MQYVIAPFVLIAIYMILNKLFGCYEEDAPFSSMEYRAYMSKRNKTDKDMNLKKLFGKSAGKRQQDDYTIENVMEYLRQEGLRPEVDADDKCVIRFKYQRKNVNVAIVDNFCRVGVVWNANDDDINAEAMCAASMKVMDTYRFIRIIFSDGLLEFAVDQIITSLAHFKEVFNISMDVIGESEMLHKHTYHQLVGDDDEANEPPRRDEIYHPEYRWLPDVVFKAVTDGRLAPEALTDEEWLRENIKNKISSSEISDEWNSFKINRIDNYGEYKLIVYQFPEPKAVPEAKYGVVLMNTTTRDIDYYTLEKTFNDKWVYGSMTSEQHRNYGEVDTDDLEKFIEWIFTRDKQLVSGVDYTKEGQKTVN